MTNKHFIRGNDLTFKVAFLDIDGVVTSPSSATLRVHYKVNGASVFAELPMIADADSLFSAVWDSSPADPGCIEWHARSSDGCADEGSFTLLANKANPSQE